MKNRDVAQALGYSNSRKALLDHVDEEDKGVTKRDTLGGKQQLLDSRRTLARLMKLLRERPEGEAVHLTVEADC